MKVRAAASVRGPPPPPHPHVNRVLNQMAKGESCTRDPRLCEALPDPKRAPARPAGLTRHRPPAPSQAGERPRRAPGDRGRAAPRPRALGWFAQLASAVAHCHKHGAVHGQLHPENVLLAAAECLQVAPAPPPHPRPRPRLLPAPRADPPRRRPQVVGFSVRALVEGVSRVVELREYRPAAGARARGKRWCAVDELFACDVGARRAPLLLLTGSYSADAVAAECDEAEQARSTPSAPSTSAAAAAAARSTWGRRRRRRPSSARARRAGGCARPRDALALVKLMLAPDPPRGPSAEQIVEDVAALLRSS